MIVVGLCRIVVSALSSNCSSCRVQLRACVNPSSTMVAAAEKGDDAAPHRSALIGQSRARHCADMATRSIRAHSDPQLG